MKQTKASLRDEKFTIHKREIKDILNKYSRTRLQKTVATLTNQIRKIKRVFVDNPEENDA